MVRTLFSKQGLVLFVYFALGFVAYGLPPYHLESGNSASQLLTWVLHVFLWPFWLLVGPVHFSL